jgi:hypothetical protein
VTTHKREDTVGRYYFHAKHGETVLYDTEGLELSSAAEIDRAVQSATLEFGGRLSDGWSFVVTDDQFRVVAKVPVRTATREMQ